MKTIKSISIFLFSFALVVVFFECFLSLGGILQPIVRIDATNGERYRPNLTCSSLFVSEGFGLAKTNTAGWFGHDFKDLGSDDISVAVIGNSFVASRQVFYRNNFLALSEKKTNNILAHKGIQKTVSFFNFGKEDLPINELVYLKDDLNKLNHPDYFLILLNEGTFSVVTHRYVAKYIIENDSIKVDSSFKNTAFVKNYNKFEVFTKSSVLFLMHRVKSHLPRIWEIFFDKFYVASKGQTSGEEEDEPTVTTSLDPENKRFISELSKDKHVIFLLNVNPALCKELVSIIGPSNYINIQPILLAMKKRGIDPNYWEIPDKVGHFNLVGHQIISDEVTKKMLNIVLQGGH
ncbi:MAG TPA: hypothetical protein VFF27_10320 [Bacteroidia bacterium]|jgi:hypothetical protein|nr:hypothetical protein [Bacteroidia bacterium]